MEYGDVFAIPSEVPKKDRSTPPSNGFICDYYPTYDKHVLDFLTYMTSRRSSSSATRGRIITDESSKVCEQANQFQETTVPEAIEKTDLKQELHKIFLNAMSDWTSVGHACLEHFLNPRAGSSTRPPAASSSSRSTKRGGS